MNNRGEFGFVWLFAIFAGAAILFLAIYGVSKFGDVAGTKTNTEIAKKLAILTDGMQAGFAEGSYGKIILNQEIKIDNFCQRGKFGQSIITVNTKVNNKWNPMTKGRAAVDNKYIFSEEESMGKEFYVFSKPFNFPYEVADMIFLTGKDYCFLGAPGEIADEIDGLNMKNIKTQNCSKNALNVCFGGASDCDITVYGACVSSCDTVYDEGTVEKDGRMMKYAGNLMYAAIFSDSDIYQCNVERLLYRAGKIAEVLEEKSDLMNARSCGTNLKPNLIFFRQSMSNSSAQDIISLNFLADDLQVKSSEELCELW